MFEHRSKPLLPPHEFYTRLARCVLVSLAVIVVALGIGMVGYHSFEKMSWVDAFVNAAMILSGMGPVTNLNTDGGKIFAGIYALFSGLTFISCIGIVFTPIFHRFLHKFHLEATEHAAKNKEAHETTGSVAPKK